MSWKNQLRDDSISWLLDQEDWGVRYLALRDLLDKPQDDPELISARAAAHQYGPIADILKQMNPEGYWAEPGAGYSAKYRSSDWSLVLLAQLGAHVDTDERVRHACGYIMDHAMSPGGQFGIYGTPSSTIDCLQGNLCWALREMGYEDPRLDLAFEWMARTVTGEGMAPKTDKKAEHRYYAYKCGPLFACGATNGQPCAWGATKVMLAFAQLPESLRTSLIKDAIQQGVDFFFSTDLLKADWYIRAGEKPSRNWWLFGFPVFYITDLLQVVEVLVDLGYADDPRLSNTLDFIRNKQDDKGRWNLEYDYRGKTWVEFGEKKQANKWVTLRALKVLKKVGERLGE